jgi:hypothetical protein
MDLLQQWKMRVFHNQRMCCMDINKISSRKSKAALLFGLVGLAALSIFCVIVVYPWLLVLADNGGIFTLTLSTADLDLDGDLDVLVHNRRNPGEFEVFAGGALWINQGGLQNGQAGRMIYQRHDIEGGLASITAELNGDGEPDVLIFDGNHLILGLNQGTELWQEASFFEKSALVDAPAEQRKKFGLASQYATLAVGDIDNDGRVDALVLGCCGRAFKVNEESPDIPNFSWVWFNQGSVSEGVYGTVASLDVLEGVPVGETALADVDGDGDLDLLVLNLKTAAGMILLNDGAGHFSDSGQHLGEGVSNSLVLGDLDNDGDPDLLLGSERGAGVWINQGGAQAGQAGTFLSAGAGIGIGQVRNVVLADMDRDGDPDALVLGKRRVSLWWNDGQAFFTRAPQSLPCSERQNLTTGDFNGDGWADIFIAQYDKRAQVWFSNGDGTFRRK